MRFGICARFQEVATLKNISFDYLEENVQRFLVPEQSQSHFEELLCDAETLPVRIEAANSLLPADLVIVTTPTQQVDKQRLENYMKTALQRAERTGIRVIVFGSGNARACPQGFDRDEAQQQIAEHLAEWSGWARNHGVQIVLEPLRYEETNTINTVAEGATLVASIAPSGAKLLADTYHMANNQEDPESLLPCGTLLAHVHVAELEGRAAPGQHGEDFRPYFSALHRADYDSRVSIECKWQDLADEVDQAIAVLREQWTTSA